MHISITFSILLSSKTIKASHSLGIALSLEPPLIYANEKSTFSKRAFKTLPISLLEFPLSLFISIPEWPPFKFLNEISKALKFSFVSSHFISKDTLVLTPPAQLTRKNPSSSESRFNNIFPSKCSPLRAIAPLIPVSSSVVTKSSKLGCGISFDANIAIP